MRALERAHGIRPRRPNPPHDRDAARRTRAGAGAGRVRAARSRRAVGAGGGQPGVSVDRTGRRPRAVAHAAGACAATGRVHGVRRAQSRVRLGDGGCDRLPALPRRLRAHHSGRAAVPCHAPRPDLAHPDRTKPVARNDHRQPDRPAQPGGLRRPGRGGGRRPRPPCGARHRPQPLRAAERLPGVAGRRRAADHGRAADKGHAEGARHAGADRRRADVPVLGAGPAC